MLSELLTRWDVPPAPTALLALVAAMYAIGWSRAHKTRPAELPPWRLGAFLAGIVSVFVAISSPLDTFSESLLFMHMAQHFVLMSVAPPLLVLGAPVVPLLRGVCRGRSFVHCSPCFALERPMRYCGSRNETCLPGSL